ncbi:hypothetical protein E4Z61_05980 [Citrobacter tructae]|uniref:Uncharacterized protein n=1 Tax=Citrobacter tructae TaxID=2562449 RepID=A0ABX5TCH7_9ENTR|nr:hypothetical protein E4Z61_05980 [Citrobacter tructae]
MVIKCPFLAISPQLFLQRQRIFLFRCRLYQRSNAAAGIGLANKNP